MVLENDAKNCVVRITHTNADASAICEYPEDVTEVQIQRRVYGATDWITVHKMPVYEGADLNFELTDYSALSHKTYEYRNAVKENDTLYYGAPVEIETEFKGILISNGKKTYVSFISPTYTLTRNYNVAFVKPYYSKYPHTVQNGLTNYTEGTFKGIFNCFDIACNVEEKFGDYAEEIIDFLADGQPKILKTFDGHGWYVMVNSGITKENNVFNMIEISFNWTEVGSYPNNIASVNAG